MSKSTAIASLLVLAAPGCTLTPEQLGMLLQPGMAGASAPPAAASRPPQAPPSPAPSHTPMTPPPSGPMAPPPSGMMPPPPPSGMMPPPPPSGMMPPPSSQPTATPAATATPVNHATLPALYAKFADTVTITMDGAMVRLATTDVPNHKSPYFGISSPMYIAPLPGMAPNPSSIAAQNYVLRVPANPAVAASVTPTNLDAIGIALNGVVLFNQYAAGMQPLGQEIVSFDQFNGHPAQRNNYHYHMEPKALTTNDSNLVGVMLDGFPIYGKKDSDGSTPTLDAANGHVGVTADFPEGIYHYHVTDAPPYFCGGFKGTKGTWTN